MRTPVCTILLSVVSFIATNGIAQPEKPLFWRGVYLFGLPQPTDGLRFFTHLSDSLHLNLFQVRTYGSTVSKARNDFFLGNPKNLKVVNQSVPLVEPSASTDAAVPDRQARSIESETRALASYPNNYRFYLADEPGAEKLDAFAATSQRVKRSHSRAKTVTALLSHHEVITDSAGLSEVLVETYFLKNNTPHPSLVNMDRIASDAGIVAWGDTGYGWYLGGLQQSINNELETIVRPAAEVALKQKGKVALIFVPQLHGILDSATTKYDRDEDLHSTLLLRPPSPSEIRLQYNLGLAYGAKGFVAYPYGFDAGHERMKETYPGLVSGEPTQTDHASNFDVLYGKRIWTGYNEKWYEVAEMNKRLQTLGDTMLTLTWVGAKSWTMDPKFWKPITTISGRWSDIVANCAARTYSRYRDDLPQVEVGHLKRGKTDYIVVVNRRAANEDKAQITITLNTSFMPGIKRWKVTDIERNSFTRLADDCSFTDRFEPGEGKIYRISK